MLINDFVTLFEDARFGELHAATFERDALTLGFTVCNATTEVAARYDVRALRPRDWRILGTSIEWATCDTEGPELAFAAAGGVRYVVVSENPDWDRLVGAVHRRFGELGVMNLRARPRGAARSTARRRRGRCA